MNKKASGADFARREDDFHFDGHDSANSTMEERTVHQDHHATSVAFAGIAMKIYGAVALVFLFLVTARVSQAGTPIPILLSTDAAPPEVTAANELAAYFGKMTGMEFVVLPEANAGNPPSAVYVGPTAFAKANGVDCAALGAEEWALKSAGRSLIVAGGRPRGTLYAAYHLLEDYYGVRWWTPWEETVPKCVSIVLPSIDLRQKPVFNYRDINTIAGPGGYAGAGPFCARNRLNRNGGAPIAKEYGGEEGYGAPNPNHSLSQYCPPSDYYDTHPEWFPLVNGKRLKEGGAYSSRPNLCLTNPELREFILQRLRGLPGYIAQPGAGPEGRGRPEREDGWIGWSRAAAEKAGLSAPSVFSVSYEESATCECPNCKALEAREGGTAAGPLLDLVNYLADNIREQYPEVYVMMLAYCPSVVPPKTIKAHDNVMVQVCDDQSFISNPITDPDNTASRENLLAWMSVCKNLRIWRYGISYGPYVGGGFMSAQVPFASAQNFGTDMRFYAEHNVRGVFIEHEGCVQADMLDFKYWMNAKFMEAPYRDYNALLKDFTDGYYGAAGPFIREYLEALQVAQEAGTPITTSRSTLMLTHFDVPFLVKAHGMFDRAEKAVQGDPVLLRRVRHARLSLDRTTLGLFHRLARGWDARKGPMPLDQNAIAARTKETWLTMIALRTPPEQQQQEKVNVEAEIARILKPRVEVELPEQFRHLPKGSVWDYTPEDFDNTWSFIRPQPDPEAEIGVTARTELTQRLPITWDLCDLRMRDPHGTKPKDLKAIKVSADIRREDIPGPGYHWFKLPSVSLGDGGYYVQGLGLQCSFNVPKSEPNDRFDIWARIKFEGPDFPHGDKALKNAICVARVVVVKSRQ